MEQSFRCFCNLHDHTFRNASCFPRIDFLNTCSRFLIFSHCSLREKCPYAEFFWSAFSSIWTECRKIRTRKTPNTDTFHAVIIQRLDHILPRNKYIQERLFQTITETKKIVFNNKEPYC